MQSSDLFEFLLEMTTEYLKLSLLLRVWCVLVTILGITALIYMQCVQTPTKWLELVRHVHAMHGEAASLLQLVTVA